MSFGKFIPFITEGATAYSSRVGVHYKILEAVTGDVLNILDTMTPRQDETFVIGDYGTADGGTSYGLITRCIGLLRRKFSEALPIQILYEDQPINNFTGIFTRAHGLEGGVPGYMETYRNVFTMACGTSFYSQCLPPSSVDLIFSATAVHVPSQSPGKLTDAISPNLAIGPEKEAFIQQAADDWGNFLLLRAKELKSGGYMILVNPTWDVPEENKDKVRTHFRTMYKPMQRAWASLRDDGIITEEEQKDIIVHYYIRSMEEFRRPFDDKSSRITESGLELSSVKTFVVPCPFRQEFDKKARHLKTEDLDGFGISGLADEFAEKFTLERRATSERFFLLALNKRRSEKEKAEIMDELFMRHRELVCKEPEENGPDYVLVVMVIKKVSVLGTRGAICM